ncbi:MAG TPA: sodium:solute symporter [Vicinamibacteria bacterium]|nr:sodium:solute symporter [Vicinamibacteria bacterium]
MHPVDWLVVVLYFGLIGFIGYRTGRGNRGIEDFLLARRAMPWYAIALSVMATQASAITLVGTTGQGYIDGMRFVQIYFGLPIAMVILCATLVPFFYRARVYTAYEYLENRFDGKTRSLTSLLFLLNRALSDAIVIYAPSVVLAIVFGIDEELIILAIGAGATIYTALGGMRAVMWVEMWQMLIILFGILFALGAVVAGLPGDVSFLSAVRLAGATGRTETVDFTFDPTVTYTFWSGLLGGTFLMLSYFGCDQSQVQRYLTARSLGESRLSLLFNALVKIPMQFVILLTGALLFVYYQFEKPPVVFNPVALERIATLPEAGRLTEQYDEAFEARRAAALEFSISEGDGPAREAFVAADTRLHGVRAEVISLIEDVEQAPFNDTNYVFPTFVLTRLPVGVVGLILVAIFAAAMSTVESELTALSSATVVDFYRRYVRPVGEDSHYLRVSRVATLFWGAVATLFALYMGRLGSVIEAVNVIGSNFYGPILGVFILAVGTRRTNGHGAFAGVLVGIVAVQLVSWLTDVSFLYYNLVGAGVSVAVGYGASGYQRAGGSV